MLVNLKAILSETKQNHRAVGSFNIYSYETIQGVADAAKKTGKPAIISFGASYLSNMDLGMVHRIVSEAVGDCAVPFALHLDHCQSLDVIRQAVEAGFTSVMYDGSALPFEENMKNTKAVVALAHEKGVGVEAELGSIALGAFSNETDIDHGLCYTNPESAAEFVKETGVDALAVSIGTVHGMYRAKPNIRVDILKEINRLVSIPLVLHGGSGTPEETIRECIDHGICKINVNTEISQYTVAALKTLLEKEPNTHLSQLSLKIREKVGEVVCKYITLFDNRKE